MWDAIQSRHPAKAAQLADSPAVIAYQSPLPFIPQSHLHREAEGAPSRHFVAPQAHQIVLQHLWASNAQHSGASTTLQHADVRQHQQHIHRSALPQAGLESLRPLTSAASATTDGPVATRRGIVHVEHHSQYIRDGPLYLIRRAPAQTQSQAQSQIQSQTPSQAQSQAESVTASSQAQSASAMQPEGLRRAQAAFADLRHFGQQVALAASDVLYPPSRRSVPATSGMF